MKYVNGVAEYLGALDVMSKVVKNEGFFALWKGTVRMKQGKRLPNPFLVFLGFTPYYLRLGPHTMIFLMFMEQLNKGYVTMVRANSHAL